jgi:outer membrane protein
MKRAIFVSVILCLFLHSYAQPAAGKIFAGGNISVQTSTNKDKNGGTTEVNNKTFSYSVGPFAGYFLSDKIAVGLGLDIGGYVNKYPNSFNDKSTSFGVGINPFARYYLLGENMGLFLEADITAGFGKNKMFAGDVSTSRNYNSFGTSVTPGFYYYISPKLAVEATIGSIGYSYYSWETGSDTKTIDSGFRFSLTSAISLGFTVTLN